MRVAAAGQAGDPCLDRAELGRELLGDVERACRLVPGGRVLGVDQHPHQPGRNTGLHQPGNPGDPVHVLLGVAAVAVGRPVGVQKPLLLVIPDEAGCDFGVRGEFADLHVKPPHSA